MPHHHTTEKIQKARQIFKRHRKGTLLTPRNTILAALALLYLISPIDLLPDWVFPLIGWLDDLGIIALAIMWMRRSPAPRSSSQREPSA